MDNVKQAIELLEAMNNTRELQLDYCKFHHIEVPARSGHGLFWFDTTTTLHKKALALLKQEPALPEPKTGTCGRCYDEPVEVFPANCNEKPENLIGQPIGQYHCPDCGAMVVAGSPHPNMCQKCIDRKHPAFDLLKQEQPKPKITDVRMECLKCHRITTVGNAIPDIDGEGSLGCPFCYDKDLERVALVEQPLSDSEPSDDWCKKLIDFIYPDVDKMTDEEVETELRRLNIDTTVSMNKVRLALQKAKDKKQSLSEPSDSELRENEIEKIASGLHLIYSKGDKSCSYNENDFEAAKYLYFPIIDRHNEQFNALRKVSTARIQQLEAEIDNLKAMLSEHSQKDK